MTISLQIDRQQHYMQQAEIEFSRIDQKIDAYQHRVQQNGLVFAAAYEIELAQLAVKRNAAQRKLQRLQEADKAHWGELQQEFEQAWNELNDTFYRTLASMERG